MQSDYQLSNSALASQIQCRLDNLHLLMENHLRTQEISSPIKSSTNRRPTDQVCVVPATPKKSRGRPKKVETNRLKPYLYHFIFPKDIFRAYPVLEDIVKGTVVADVGGNTRPLSKNRMITLLQNLDTISTDAVQAEMQCSVRHAQKVAMCLRIIERHAYDIAKDSWIAYEEDDWAGID